MDDYIPEPLQDIAAKVQAGQQPSITLRTLLSWYGAERWGGWRNRKIGKHLKPDDQDRTDHRERIYRRTYYIPSDRPSQRC